MRPADYNGVYLLGGRHGNGCRQSEGERERRREWSRESVRVYSCAAQCAPLYSPLCLVTRSPFGLLYSKDTGYNIKDKD